MGQCCTHSYDFQPETNIKDSPQPKKETKKEPKKEPNKEPNKEPKEDNPQPKKEDTPVYHIRRINKGKNIILPYH